MRVPLSWLREYVDFDLTDDELVSLFSLRSQEVDGVERLGVLDGEVVVGEVLSFGPHPNADRLSVAKVDLGGREVQVVAGAPNPYPGAKVPVVLPGSTMSDGTKLRKVKLRGLESYGMMMSERELGISGDHGGILLLDADAFEVGRPVEDYFPVGETVLELDVNPNRPDLWGMVGVARELAAILDTDFRIPDPKPATGGAPTEDYTLRVEDPELCPRYDLRRVSGVVPGDRAPLWMRRHIHAAGMRPVNAVVDATNYVMLETGQPIHAFDAAKVRGGIVVRRGRRGEKMSMLDGHVRNLDEDMLVIADEERGLVVAGVMGAEDAEVSDETDDVLVEAANFVGENIMATSQRLGLRTDASGRFERGLDPNMVSYAMDRVTSLISEVAGGAVAPDTLSHYPEPAQSWQVSMRLSRAESLLGMPVDGDEAVRRLESLGCQVRSEDGRLVATAPTFRRDLRREADLIEEVGRLVGLENVPEEIPGVPLPGGLTTAQAKLRTLRRLLADLGLNEAVTYPFGPDRWGQHLGMGEPVKLRNPLSAEAGNLRASLLPGLLDAAARNRGFGARGGALFEVGSVFRERAQAGGLRESALRFRFTGEVGPDAKSDAALLMGVEEEMKVAGLFAGTIRPDAWNTTAETAGYFEAKGVVERLVTGARFEPTDEPFLHPGRSAAVLVGEDHVGWVGELHPETAEGFELSGWPVAAFELDLGAAEPGPEPQFRPFVNVPAVTMDLAVVVDEDVAVGAMLDEVDALRSPLLTGTRVFDVYKGSQVREGEKSIALSFTFQAEETLTDEVVKSELELISARLGDVFGAEVRGG